MGLELNLKIFGQGPALVILHGLFGSLDNWVSLAKKLAESYSVYLVDQRNHGRSPHHDRMDYEAMADDLLAFLDTQGIYQAHLLGHSMGGKTVMHFAGQHGDRVDKLVVLDMAPKAYEPHHNVVLEALASLPLDQLNSRKEAADHLGKTIVEPEVRQFLLKSLKRDKNNQFRWKFNLATILADYDHILASIEMEEPFEGETLFLTGGASPYVEKSDHEAITEMFPYVQFVTLSGVGHWVHAEAPDAFLKEVTAFLQ